MSHLLNPFQGQTLWVTGGAGYLGSAITAALDSLADKVLCIDLPGRAQARIDELGLRRTRPCDWDLTDASAIEPRLTELVRSEGLPDAVAHLAYVSSAGRRVEELSAEEFSRTMTQAVASTFALCRGLAERMKPRGRGNVVLFSSMYGVVSPDPHLYTPPMAPNPIDYGASKAAFLQMTRYLAVHYAPSGLRFNSVVPGTFPNPNLRRSESAFVERLKAKTPMGRVGHNSEIVGPTLFLLGDHSSYVTAQSLVVDGGWTAW